MNTIAWVLKTHDDRLLVWALYEAIVLHVKVEEDVRGMVWHRSFEDGDRGAHELLVDETSLVERKGGHLLGEPVRFDLSGAAIGQIRHDVTLGWVEAPILHRELIAAITEHLPSSAWSTVGYTHPGGITTTKPTTPSGGTVYYNPSINKISVYNGSKWITMSSDSGETTRTWGTAFGSHTITGPEPEA